MASMGMVLSQAGENLKLQGSFWDDTTTRLKFQKKKKKIPLIPKND